MSTDVIVSAISFGLLGLLILGLIVWTVRARQQEQEGFNSSPPHLRSPTPVVSLQPPDTTAHSNQPSATMPSTLVGRLLQNLSPDLIDLMDLPAYIQKKEQEVGRPLTKEEKERTMQDALADLTRQHPDNLFLRQMLDAMRNSTGTDTDSIPDNQIKVYKVNGKVTIRVNDSDFASLDEIPDPTVREQVRKLLALIGDHS